MLKCVNEQCKNYGQELETGTEICPLCGAKAEQSKSRVNNNLGAVVSIASIASILIFWAFFFEGWLGIILSVACIILAFISRSKAAIIVTIASFLAILAMMVYFFDLF